MNALRLAVVFALSLFAMGLVFASTIPGAPNDQSRGVAQYESGPEYHAYVDARGPSGE